MATAITVQEIVVAGITPTYGAADAAGNTVANDGNVFLHVKNSGVETTLTITTPGTVGGVAIADPTVTIPATTGDKMVGPFDPTIFNGSGGTVALAWSQVTGITIAAIKLTR